ncbi:MAG: SUMF1/EgtB/PvdO family nonheme iron enzyme [Pseudomonadota bacterium]
MNIVNILKKRYKPTTQKDFKPIKNPYIVGNPIKSTEMFFGREDDFKNIQNWIINEGPHVILLIGGRRSGKTSILWQILGGRLRQAGEAVLCDFHKIVPRIKQDEDFPFEVGKAILENPNFQPFEADFMKEDNTSWTVRLEQLVQNCLALINGRKLIILCDEFEAIEELFKSQLSPNALSWVKQVLNLPVHFVITGSHSFDESTVRAVFAPVAQIYPIYELSMPDVLALIQNPIGENLIYKDKVPKRIYRLSGGHPFYTQYICHTLINYVNAEIKRNYVVAKDLDGVIEFIVRSPTGHIQETWRSLSNPDTAPKYGRETLAALANTIRHSKKYVSTSSIFKTVRKKRFNVDEPALHQTLAWFIKNTRLLERQSENYRFRTDLIRHWIAYEFQTGEDIEPLVGASVVPTLTPEGAGQVLGIPFNWIQKYKESCHHLKSQYPNGVPKNALKNLHDTYISNDRISEAKAKEIEAYIYGSRSLPARQKHRAKYLWARIADAYYIYGSRSLSAIQKPRVKYRWAAGIALTLGILIIGGTLFLPPPLPSNQGNILQDEVSGLVFVWIPNCDFDDNCTSGFWMSKTEVSQKQWMQVMKSKNPSYYQKGDTYPVEYINWRDAKAFAAKVNKRLCSPQEWQKAFRYLKKEVALDNAILEKKTNAGPEPVDSLGDESEFGVLNLIGNVSEWLDDNGQAAYSGLYWADIRKNSKLELANQRKTVFDLFKSSRIGFRLCMTRPR